MRELDQQDVSTYGLTFTIQTSRDITLFTSVVIEQNELTADKSQTYNVLYSKNFNPNLTEYHTYAKDVDQSILASLILELSLVYFENLSEERIISPQVKSIIDNIEKDLYQCSSCQTVYDAEYGDTVAGHEPGTLFRELPESYTCPTCGKPKTSFKIMQVG